MAKKAIKQRLSWKGRILTIEYPSIKKSFVADTSVYGEAIDEQARDHGYAQKYGDAASGKSAAEKYAEVQAIHASLLEGEWKRTANPDLRPIVALAISRLQKLDLAKVEAAVEKASEEEFAKWAKNPEVKAEILEIRKERLLKEAEDAEELEFTLEDE